MKIAVDTLVNKPDAREPIVQKFVHTEFIKLGIAKDYEEERLKISEIIVYCLEPKDDVISQFPMKNEVMMKFILQNVSQIIKGVDSEIIDNMCKGLFDHLRNRGIKLYSNYVKQPSKGSVPGNSQAHNLSRSILSWKNYSKGDVSSVIMEKTKKARKNTRRQTQFSSIKETLTRMDEITPNNSDTRNFQSNSNILSSSLSPSKSFKTKRLLKKKHTKSMVNLEQIEKLHNIYER
jgi:hypothetical protein